MSNRSCFILMPFTKANDLGANDLTFIYENIIRKAVSVFQYNDEIHFQNVARYESKVGSIIEGIVNNLNDSELVIADLTGFNPNVMYELGVRHSLRKGTIIITQNINELPSDLRDYFTIEYKYCKNDTITQSENYNEFETKIHAAILEVIAQSKNDSPVLNYLNQRQRFRNELEIERVKDDFVVVHSIHTIIHEIDDVASIENGNGNSFEHDLLFIELIHSKINSLQKSIDKLSISYSSKSIFNKIITTKVLLESINHYLIKNIEQLTQVGFNRNYVNRPTMNKVLNHNIVNLFSIDLGKLEYESIGGLFKEKGILETQLLEPLKNHIDIKIREHGIEKNEIVALL